MFPIFDPYLVTKCKLINLFPKGEWHPSYTNLVTRLITLPKSICSEILFPLAAAAAAAKSLQSCPTLCDPMTAAHQALLSLGFSRQEHWSGLPFPSPMRESEK